MIGEGVDIIDYDPGDAVVEHVLTGLRDGVGLPERPRIGGGVLDVPRPAHHCTAAPLRPRSLLKDAPSVVSAGLWWAEVVLSESRSGWV